MGTFHVDVEIGDPEGRRYEPVEALGVEPHQRAWFRLADGRLVERAIGRAWVRVGERAEPTLVVFAEPGSPALFGAYSLEGLRLAPDPVGRGLVPVTSFSMSFVPTLT
jgi:hypothetical protein